MIFAQLEILLLTINSAPTPSPDFREILIAHSNAAEFTKVHSVAGLSDPALFASAHSRDAPNSPDPIGAIGNPVTTIGSFLVQMGGPQGIVSAILRGRQAAGSDSPRPIRRDAIRQSLLAAVAMSTGQQIPAGNLLAVQFASGSTVAPGSYTMTAPLATSTGVIGGSVTGNALAPVSSSTNSITGIIGRLLGSFSSDRSGSRVPSSYTTSAAAAKATGSLFGVLSKRETSDLIVVNCLTLKGLTVAQSVIDMGMNTDSFDEAFK